LVPKAQVKWITQGNQNARYFHGVKNIRRNTNIYDMLKNDIGMCISDPFLLEELAINYFERLFNE